MRYRSPDPKLLLCAGHRSSSSSGGSGGSSASNGAASSAKPSRLSYPGLSEMFAYHATTMANTIRTSLLVFSRKVRPSAPCPTSMAVLPHVLSSSDVRSPC